LFAPFSMSGYSRFGQQLFRPVGSMSVIGFGGYLAPVPEAHVFFSFAH
jgi:hypothetical protein